MDLEEDDLEFVAMAAIKRALLPLDETLRDRVIKWAAARFEINLAADLRKKAQGGGARCRRRR